MIVVLKNKIFRHKRDITSHFLQEHFVTAPSELFESRHVAGYFCRIELKFKETNEKNNIMHKFALFLLQLWKFQKSLRL